MNDKEKTREQLIKEVQKLRRQISEVEKLNAERIPAQTTGESEQQYRTTIDSMGDAIHVIDQNLRIVLFNNAFKQWTKNLGLGTNVIGKPIFDVCTFLPEKVREEYRQVFDTGKMLVTEEISEVKGERFITETRKIPIFENKKVDRIVTVVRDITKRSRAEQALRESEEKYRTLVQTSPDAVVVSDLQGKIMAVSSRALELYGTKDANDLLGKSSFELIVPEDREKAMQNMQRVMKEQTTINAEYTLVKKDGTCYLGELNASLIRGAQGQPKAFIATVRDITERKRAHEALRRSEEKYKTLTENINVGVYRNTAGPRGKFIEVNPAIVKMFGYNSKEEFLTLNVTDLYQNPEDRKGFNEKMLRNGFVENKELRLKKKDGTPMTCSVSAVAVMDKDGSVKYYDGIVEDVTEVKRSEHDIRGSFDKLNRVLEETVDALASTLGKRDPYTGGHQKRVTSLACAIAEELGLSKQKIKGLRLAGLLHDIGKIAIPAEILSKPSRLTEAEFNIVKDHPQIGYEILKAVEFPWPIADIVLQHHELLDGSGYPRGIKDGSICMEAKIMVVADVVEAMCSHRPYRPAHSLEVSLDEIAKYRGILYDTNVVDTCLRLFAEKGFIFNETT